MTMINAYDRSRTGALSDSERALIVRREHLLGPAYRLFYARPVHVVRGEGVWLYGPDGERYLDAYNNVASVGHCHPRIVEAIAAQAGTLNTHTRYLNDVVLDYAEALLATLPDAIGHIMFTCTGSEANDLALRVARATTGGRGVIVTGNAYHGVTELLAGLSPSLGPDQPLHPFVRTVTPPGDGDGDAFGARVAAAAADLADAGHGPATLLLDTILSSDGVLGGPAELLGPAVEAIRAASGLFIADEVQAGLGRVGESFWGFRHHGLQPDIVTCGKPMGNGHPVAMAACRPALADAFGTRVRYFNTFGGNPVSAAAGRAVLDVMREEELPQRAARVGAYLRDRLSDLGSRSGRLTDVRGAGLSIGVGLATAEEATAIVNDMRERGVLISATGPKGDALKIRPPLVFETEHADLLVTELARSLESLP